jgi:3',5'-cyclic AMP phosphodiesterase CpdA
MKGTHQNDDFLLLFLTDLHFGEEFSQNFAQYDFSYDDIARLISIEIRKFPERKIIIALGGDVTNRGAGNKYQYAHGFIKKLREGLKDYELDFILCPGNHDIDTDSKTPLAHFNIFCGELTGSNRFAFNDSRTCLTHTKFGHAFVVANSVFRGKTKYGLVDERQLVQELKRAKQTGMPIIMMTHHHLVPIYENDTSTTRNSYSVLKLCQEYNVQLILHGHVHSAFRLELAQTLTVVGCGAPLINLATGYNNQFVIVRAGKEILNYRIIFDSTQVNGPDIITTKL